MSISSALRVAFVLVLISASCGRGVTAEQDSVLTQTVCLTENLKDTFDRFDVANGRGYSAHDNSVGKLAWMEAYQLQAYMEMYRATGDAKYLRSLVAHFTEVLSKRDDVTGKMDVYTSRSLAGWGTDAYLPKVSGKPWHVFIVHTGNITLGPAEFVAEVSRNPVLKDEFSSSAAFFAERIRECIRDTESYWKNGPAPDEGYYTDPALGVLPLNQFTVLGSTMLEMHKATGNPAYLDKVSRMARFLKNRLRKQDPAVYDWAYWPKPDADAKGSEDISHAAINVAFAARCASAGIVFDKQDMARFARTWLLKVKRSDGSWATHIDGNQSENKGYMPQAAGRWLILCDHLEEPLRSQLYANVASAFNKQCLTFPSQILGVAALLRHRTSSSDKAEPGR